MVTVLGVLALTVAGLLSRYLPLTNEAVLASGVRLDPIVLAVHLAAPLVQSLDDFP